MVDVHMRLIDAKSLTLLQGSLQTSSYCSVRSETTGSLIIPEEDNTPRFPIHNYTTETGKQWTVQGANNSGTTVILLELVS